VIWSRNKKPRNRKVELSPRAYDATAVMILFAQLPHLLHLPIWISAFGVGIVAMKRWSIHNPTNAIVNLILSSRASVFWGVLGGVAIKLHFGYFIGRDPCVAFLFLLVGCKFAETRKQSDATTIMCLSGFLLLTSDVIGSHSEHS